MDIHLVQMAIARNKPALNRAKVQALTAPLAGRTGSHGAGKAGSATAGLLVLPELFSTGFLDETSAAQPGPEGETWDEVSAKDREFLGGLAASLGLWVSGTSVEAGIKDSGRPRFRNVVLVYGPDGRPQTRYQKIHPFSYGGEDKLFTGGAEAVTFELEDLVVQPTICYDLRFPELFRAGSQRGAHLILVQANWPEARQAHWEILLKARAIENQAFVAGVNCVGSQATLRYVGGSMLVSPKGEVLAQAGDAEGVFKGKLDADICRQWRKAFPALRDRMPPDFFRA